MKLSSLYAFYTLRCVANPRALSIALVLNIPGGHRTHAQILEPVKATFMVDLNEEVDVALDIIFFVDLGIQVRNEPRNELSILSVLSVPCVLSVLSMLSMLSVSRW